MNRRKFNEILDVVREKKFFIYRPFQFTFFNIGYREAIKYLNVMVELNLVEVFDRGKGLGIMIRITPKGAEM